MRSAQLRRCFVGLLAAFALPAALAVSAGPAFAMATPRLKPSAPGPAYLTPGDLEHLKEVREAVERRNWAKAHAEAADVADPLARSLAQWFYFYAEDPQVSLSEADSFLDAHPGWPALAKIRAAVEKRISSTAPTELILEFFATRDPVTGEGELQLARAQFAADAKEAGVIHVRKAWVKHDFTLADEQRLLARYGNHLTAEDHAARVDRLLWDREVTAARRVFPRLSAGERRKAEARAALLLGQASAPELFQSLKIDDRLDPGVMLAAVRYYRRKEEEPMALAIARQAPGDPQALRNPVAWWSERQLLMRWAMKERLYADAYAMALGHGLDVGNEFAEAEFAAGWIALRFLNAPERAEAHFRALANSVGAPISVARAYYWLGRAAEARRLDIVAKERYARAAQFIYTYYGQLAAEKVGAPLAAQTFAAPLTPSPEESARFSSRPLAAALKMLADLEADREFLVFAYQLDDELDSAGEYVELARLADRRGATHVAVRAGKVGIGRNAFAAEVAYPLVFVPDEAMRFAPAEVILGLSRQESEFNPRAYSSAGARGLMQLIPSTALATARRAGLRYSRSDLLDDPVYNMIIGSAHVKQLFDKYGGSRVMTFAAYNAGPNRLDEWIARYGDPRSPDVDPVDWVEQIPFAETRNYVQRVLENTQVYRGRLTAAPIAGKLADDLELGGPGKRVGALPNEPYQFALPPLPERTARLASAAPSAPPPAAVDVEEPTEEPAAAEAAVPSSGAGGAAPANQDVSLGTEGLSDADKADYIGDKAQRAAPLKIEPKPAKARSRKATPAAPVAASSPTPSAAPADPARPALAGEPPPAADPSAAEPIPAAPAPTPALSPAGAPITTEGDPLPALADDAAARSDPSSLPNEECGAYRNFLAATAKKDATAADLNAGMLADFESGVCKGGSAVAAPSTN